MLPGHGYPELKKYKHLYGNFGGAWQLQQMEFSQFKGPILMTSNCILEPRKSYRHRIYTTNAAGFPGVAHLATNDFSTVIEQALSMDGFTAPQKSDHTVLTGFGHNAVLGVADKVVGAVKSGDIKHFFLVGGCDGAEGERNYFKEIAEEAPKDSVILTLACGKYRFNKMQKEFGDIGGIPRLLDMGQCNDAYSAVQVAVALQNAFGMQSVNDLPLSFVVSWFEQKAVAVLLALLKLNIQHIRLGPKLPAFATPAMVEILQKNFQLKIIDNVETDMKNMLNNQ
jgi:hydroxylamine reductase